MQVLPAQQSILNAMEAFEEKPDAILVLAYLPRRALMELAKALPEVDVIVGGPTGQTISPTRRGSGARDVGNEQRKVFSATGLRSRSRSAV